MQQVKFFKNSLARQTMVTPRINTRALRSSRPILNVATPSDKGDQSSKPPKEFSPQKEEGSISQPQPTPTVVETTSSATGIKKDEVIPSTYVDLPIETLKGALLDSLQKADRGRRVSKDERGEIDEYIVQLEAKNPTPAPTEMTEMLSGKWKLVYTSNPRFLNAFNLPSLELGDIFQTIDMSTLTLENRVEFSVPLFNSAFDVQASLKVLSPKRLLVKFEKRIFERPALQDDFTVPNEVNVLGQTINISQINQPLTPVYEALFGQIEDVLRNTSNLEFPVDSQQASSQLLTVYLDEELRISKTSNGTVYVSVKVKPEELETQEIIGEAAPVVV
eukprot:TRINITY_DN3869_c1_g3_i2.p1 TRINITY_DN3869_c1_g3~~TRINITY_DN3869_c1_g3_i2.p1  ORF type:complete len:366 (-),score=55.10 TRINITY_DN3869_c1_g3_i2:256-1254(-)